MTINRPLLIKYISPIVLLAIGFSLKNGLLVELAINWILLLLIEKQGLWVLGLLPTKKTSIQLLVGFGIAAIFCALNYGVQAMFSGSIWTINSSFTPAKFLSGGWWTMQSVLYEELIFRGALLYIAIQKIGEKRAIWLSAICFGVYHWFSMGAFGNWVVMAYLFVGTGIMGYIFALAFTKTKSLFLPIGLHFGWNLINNIVFSQGPNGDQLLIIKRGDFLNMMESIIVMLIQFVAFPLVAYVYIKSAKSAGDEHVPGKSRI
jgi:membrane protease YdiL (CAAX protease family)